MNGLRKDGGVHRPRLFRGPASPHQQPGEVIREFGVGGPHDTDAPGGLISIRQESDGALTIEIYRVTGAVSVFTYHQEGDK